MGPAWSSISTYVNKTKLIYASKGSRLTKICYAFIQQKSNREKEMDLCSKKTEQTVGNKLAAGMGN